MLDKILSMLENKIEENNETKVMVEVDRLEVIKEIETLELELSDAISEAERWGDLNDQSCYRTVKVNRLKREVDIKIKKLKRINGEI